MGRFIVISIFFLMLSSCGSNNAKLEAELVEMKKWLNRLKVMLSIPLQRP